MENPISIREINYYEDLNEIIALIQKDLDANFTKEFFQWKHMENPCGKSFGLVALDKGKIIGLRMFMYWEFYDWESKITYKAIRPVDTVTDRNYRGKGLFKKLTLLGLQDCRDTYDFIFNTPNNNSLPGYLKMGWEKIDYTPEIKLGIINPFIRKKKYELIDLQQIQNEIVTQNFATSKTNSFLIWRYGRHNYKTANFDNSGYMIYVTRRIKGIKTLVIYELLGDIAIFSTMVSSVATKEKCIVVYYLNSEEFDNVQFVKSFSRNIPVIVKKENRGIINNRINFSLGDLESKL